MKFLNAHADISKKIYIIERRIVTEIVKFTNENDMFCTWRDFKKKVCGGCTINETFQPKVSSIFHIKRVNDGRVSQIPCVKADSMSDDSYI